ncbi:MAG: YfhO family protein [bacterium]|nr:YfhO family protein [bacterium]
MLLAILVFALANIVNFWPLYFKGLIPFPGDLLVSFFFPWSSGGFAGFNPWTTHKEYLAADAIRQMFVWKSLGFTLWNPYNFSGSFLFANLQSSLLFPGNWNLSVVLVMSLFGFFTYLFLRSLKLSNLAAIFGGLAAANISYLTGWQEILVNCQSALFLPLILLLINKKNTLFASVFLAFSIFGGHVQTTVYVYIIAGLFAIYRKQLRIFVFCCLLSIGLAAIQLVPTIEAYFYSAREAPANAALIARTVFPLKGLITYFASDFFGNTASFNFQLFNYPDARSYIGLVAGVFSLFSIYLLKNKNVRFFLFLAGFGLLFATWPLGLIFNFLHIPILSSVVPARMIMVSLFACAILAAYGFDYVINNKIKIKPLLFVSLVFISLWVYVLIVKTPETLVSRNNLIIPTLTFFVLVVCLLLKKKILIVLIFALAILEPGYYFVKHQPFSKQEYIFPPHPVFNFLKTIAPDRFFGFGTARMDTNFATYYRVFDPNGYDPLYIKRYGELIYSSKNGKYLPREVPRSDASFTDEDSFYRNRLFDLLGVKYILDKEDMPADDWKPDLGKFSESKYKVAWHINKWSAFERLSVLPRAFLADNYIVESDPQKILDKIYDPNFDLQKTLILEEKIAGFYPATDSGQARMTEYDTQKVVIQTQSDSPKLLFLSDNYYVGWKAFINGVETKIYRADYSFRAVPVPAGSNEVIFVYDPLSFKLGVGISVTTMFRLRYIGNTS